MKILYWITSILLLSLTLTGCQQEKKWRIGVSQCSSDDWRDKMNGEIDREMLFHEDAEVEIRSADDNCRRQIDDLRYFADNGFDIIIVSPNEADSLTPVIKEIYDRGIPVIIFDRNIYGDSYTARIGADDVGLGRAAARFALSETGHEPKALEIYGLKGSTPAEDRHSGFADEFSRGGGRLAAIGYGKWNMDDAVRAVDSLLDINSDIDVIYCHNDRMAIGAAEVARRHGLDHVKIVGIDAAPEIGVKAVADGVIDATFLYPTEGHKLIQTALAILRGEPYERDEIIPAASAVDSSNADILLLQNASLAEETAKMELLKSQVDDYWTKHSAQTTLFYALIVILVLVSGVLFLLLRAFWQHRRHQVALMEQNKLLELERDKQKELNEQLNAATQSKLAFFTNVSHDLRTPLTLIAEPVEQMTRAGNLTEQQHMLMRIADKNVRILRRLINQILDFRKYENGRLTLALEEVDVRSLVDEWVEAFRPLARKHDIKLTVECSGEVPPSMAMDVEKMERVVFNIVSNAFKYTPDNGSITVRAGMDGGSLVIEVADTGKGIPEDDIDKIFDCFYQVDKVSPQGSGIGLSLAKAFVELHGGRISVSSVPGEGSEFRVEIPVTHVASEAAESARVASGQPDEIDAELGSIEPTDADADDGKPLLLVIDDNADMRLLVASLMKDEYRIATAADGRQGLKAAARYVPDLIICDVMMPVMDGLECCRQLKSEISTSHIPVLLLTACAMDEQRVEGYDSGADGYLSKPFNEAVLKSRCRSLVANRKRIHDLWSGADTAAPAEAATRKNAPSGSGGADIDNDFYSRFIDVFQRRMGEAELSVDTLAAEMGLGRSQLYRKIKALTNYSPVELMRSLRLRQARSLLTSTDKTISEIAYEVGFSSPAYFTKCYKDAYGETPTELRDRLA